MSIQPDPKIVSVVPSGWSADGKAILCLIVPKPERSGPVPYSLVWVSTSDGAMRVIKTLEPWQLGIGFQVSPDGRFIAYSAVAREGSSDQHIYVVDANGQSETDVVKIAGANTQPMWAPEGSHFLFISDRSGARALWSVAMQGGTPSGEPSLLRADFAASPVGMTNSGDLYYTQNAGGGAMEFIAERRQAGTQVVQAPHRRQRNVLAGREVDRLQQDPGEEQGHRRQVPRDRRRTILIRTPD